MARSFVAWMLVREEREEGEERKERGRGEVERTQARASGDWRVAGCGGRVGRRGSQAE